MRFHEAIHGVYFDDLDHFGVLHNARYLLLIERTIGAFWQKLGWGGLAKLNQSPDQFHLVRVNHFEYLRAVQGVDEVRVRIWVERLGRTSLTFGFRMLPVDEDEAYAKGSRVLVCVDRESRRPRAWTDDFRERIHPYRADAES
jgi:acyl-CoA thioester hydrolase